MFAAQGIPIKAITARLRDPVPDLAKDSGREDVQATREGLEKLGYPNTF